MTTLFQDHTHLSKITHTIMYESYLFSAIIHPTQQCNNDDGSNIMSQYLLLGKDAL